MKGVACFFIWWPGIDSEIEGITKSKESCLNHGENSPKVVLHCWLQLESPA